MDPIGHTIKTIDNNPDLPKKVLHEINLDLLFEIYFLIIYQKNRNQNYQAVRTYFAGIVHFYFKPEDEEEFMMFKEVESVDRMRKNEEETQSLAVELFYLLHSLLEDPSLLLAHILRRWDVDFIIKGFKQSESKYVTWVTFSLALDLLTKMIDFKIFETLVNESMLSRMISVIHNDILRILYDEIVPYQIDFQNFRWIDAYITDLKISKCEKTLKGIYIRQEIPYKIWEKKRYLRALLLRENDLREVSFPGLMRCEEYQLPPDASFKDFASDIHFINKPESISLLRIYKPKSSSPGPKQWQKRYYSDRVGQLVSKEYGSLFPVKKKDDKELNEILYHRAFKNYFVVQKRGIQWSTCVSLLLLLDEEQFVIEETDLEGNTNLKTARDYLLKKKI